MSIYFFHGLDVEFSFALFFILGLQPSATENGPYDYTRSGNPTRDALERCDFAFFFCISK